MAAKRYSAGTIFLQVVPVFRNVQDEIERHAKDINKSLGGEMEKAGDEAGRRAGKAASKSMNEELKKGSGDFEREFQKTVGGIESALAGINTNKLGNNLRREVAEIKRDLAGLKDLDLTADADFKRAYAEIAVLEGRLRGMRDDVKLVFRADIDSALKGIAKVQAAKEAIDDPVEIPVSVDYKGAARELSRFEQQFKKTMKKAAESLSGDVGKQAKRLRSELEYLENLRIGVDISANAAKAELKSIRAEIERLQADEVNIDTKVAYVGALKDLAVLEAAADALDRKDVDIDVKADTSKAQRGLFGVARSGDDAANSFRSFNIILLAVAGAGPALVPVLGAIAGGLLALGPAAAVAGAGLGTVLVGFSGLGDALTALGAQQDQMATNTTNAANAERNAAQAVADARRSAARAVEAALQRQADAQEAYRDSINDVREAEQALAEARAAARGTGADIKERLSDNALAQDQGLLDVFNATVSYNAIQADGSATNAEQEQARINLENARDALDDLRKEERELRKEQRKWQKEGVDGTEEVQSAEEALADAVDRQREAYEDLRDAARDVDQARVDGARSVQRALQGQAEAMAAVDTQAQNVATAFDKLGPAGREFALFLFGLRQGFYDFRDDVQTVLLPAVQEAISSFLGSPSAEVARRALIGLAEAFGEFVLALSQSFQGSAWTGFFQMLADLGPDIQAAYGEAFVSFLEAMASIMTTLAPYALDFAEGLAAMMDSFARWSESKEGAEALQGFMGYVEEVAPAVLEFVGAFAGAFANLAKALAPYGGIILDKLTGFLEFIANMDTDTLGQVASAILILATASQIAYGFMSALLAGAALFSSTVGLIVFGFVGIGLAVAYLYHENEAFKEWVDENWPKIRDAFLEAWAYIKPALREFWGALKVLWKEVLQPFIEWLAPKLEWMLETLVPAWGASFASQIRLIAWVLEKILVPIFKFVGRFVGGIIDGVIWAFKELGEAWGDLADDIRTVWGDIKDIWDYIRNDALKDLQRAFENTIENIGEAWDNLRALVGRPVRFVIETVLNNGLIAGFNNVARAVGSDIRIDDIPVPNWTYATGGVFGRRTPEQSFATGGTMPGYTPGRDVHRFYSPTAGYLNLSGGEAIMRPEFTRAVGPQFVDAANAAARQGGVGGVRKLLNGERSYWLGGVLPLLGASVSTHHTGYSGYAADLNYPGYADYGKPVVAWKSGTIGRLGYVGDDSYGRWVDINHGGSQFSRYAHLSEFAEGLRLGMQVAAGQTVGYVGDLGNTGNPPTSHLHFEINGGSSIGGDDSGQGSKPEKSWKSWLVDVATNPFGYIKEQITGPIDRMREAFGSSDVLGMIASAPAALAKAAASKVYDMLPGGLKRAAGVAGDAIGLAGKGLGVLGGALDAITPGDGVPGVESFYKGGILPYNGTMMYDDGGYLPPGMTTVVNLTGKPEPVFTADQWDKHEGGGGNLTYAPTFEGSDLTADDVAHDMEFGFRKMRRGGRYAIVGGRA